MARVRTLQSSFTSGELDPLLAARSDVKHYYSGAEKMRNVLALPQGGFKRRFGTLFVEELQFVLTAVDLSAATVTAPNGGTAANAYDGTDTNVVTSTVNISTTNPYVLLHVDLGSAQTIQFADVYGLKVTSATSSGEWAIQYSTDNVTFTTLGSLIDTINSSARTRRKTGPISARYWRVARIGATDLGTDKATLTEFKLWKASASLSEVKVVPFEFSTEQSYLMFFTDRNIRVVKDGVTQVDIPTTYTSAELSTISHTQNLDTLIVFHEDHMFRSFMRQGAHDEWQPEDWTVTNTPTYKFDRVTTASGTPGSAAIGTGVNFAATGQFVAGDVGKAIRGNGGYARITAYVDANNVTVTIADAFTNTNAIAAGAWYIEEAVWSSTRGYPRCGTFFQGRLWVAGSKQRPQSIWASRAGNFNDFDIGSAQDDEAIDITADTDDVSAFYAVLPGRHLQFFASSAEFYIPKSETDGLTPENVVLRRTTKRGTKRGIPVFDIDGATIFLQREGKALREFLFVDTEQAYQANNLSLLCSHLIVDPVDMDMRRSTSTDEADYIFLVNSDGTVAAFCTLRTQNVNAFTLLETEGTFLACGVDQTVTYFVVERDINGTTRRFIEKADEDALVDCGVRVTSGLPLGSASGLSHLNGETARIILDGNVQADQEVAAGSITFVRAAASEYQVGLAFPDVSDDASGFETMVRTMPIEPNLPDGTSVGRRKRVVEVVARVKDTKHLVINDNYIPFRQLGSDLLDQETPSFTGDKRVRGLSGWDDKGQVTMAQTTSQPLTLLGVAMKVAM